MIALSTADDAVLHLVYSIEGLRACLDRKGPDDPVVLMIPCEVRPRPHTAEVYSLIRGAMPLPRDQARDEITMDRLVTLTESHSRVLSW